MCDMHEFPQNTRTRHHYSKFLGKPDIPPFFDNYEFRTDIMVAYVCMKMAVYACVCCLMYSAVMMDVGLHTHTNKHPHPHPHLHPHTTGFPSVLKRSLHRHDCGDCRWQHTDKPTPTPAPTPTPTPTTTPTHYRLAKGFGNGASTAITIGIAVATIVTDAVGRALIAIAKTLAVLFLTLVQVLKSQLYGHSA